MTLINAAKNAPSSLTLEQLEAKAVDDWTHQRQHNQGDLDPVQHEAEQEDDEQDEQNRSVRTEPG